MDRRGCKCKCSAVGCKVRYLKVRTRYLVIRWVHYKSKNKPTINIAFGDFNGKNCLGENFIFDHERELGMNLKRYVIEAILCISMLK